MNIVALIVVSVARNGDAVTRDIAVQFQGSVCRMMTFSVRSVGQAVVRFEANVSLKDSEAMALQQLAGYEAFAHGFMDFSSGPNHSEWKCHTWCAQNGVANVKNVALNMVESFVSSFREALGAMVPYVLG